MMRSRILAVAALLGALALAALVWPGNHSANDMGPGRGTSTTSAPVPDPTATTSSAPEVASDLTTLHQLVERLGVQVSDGEPVEGEVLSALTEAAANVADWIETGPDSDAWEDVVDYIQAVADARMLLAGARVDPRAERQLREARVATQDGVRIASEYFAARR